MKKKKRAKRLLNICLTTFNLIAIFAMSVNAHSAVLDINYDNCAALLTGDGTDEIWYILEGFNRDETAVENLHLGHDVQTIVYYFEPEYTYKDKYDREHTYTWTTTVGAPADDIKAAYANSMKKWNNVYFYTYSADGSVTKNKLINIIEGTASNHNLSIFPAIDDTAVAITAEMDEGVVIEAGAIPHKHYSQWTMWLDVTSYYENALYDENEVRIYREWTGAHEIGHILGLRDVDRYCEADDSNHHEELLMGYGDIYYHAIDITYKDIAGVAITRGFHTDNDHKWLYAGQQSDGTYKLICTICNGVKKVDSLSGYTYDVYGSCGDNHDLADGNMMAVASYGAKDYYKCKYCRYVAPFDNNVEQNYVATAYKDGLRHWCVNDVAGLEYTTEEDHSYTYTHRDSTMHTGICNCGYTITERHWVRPTSGRYANCVDCGALIDLGGTITPVNPFNITKVSVNGSYILPNGIAVIVDADVEAYINGTLVFYNPDELPVTQ